MISKLVFLFDSGVDPFEDFDVSDVKMLLKKVRGTGTICEVIDTKELRPADMETWREKATVIAVRHHVRVRKPFGSRRGGGLPFLGKQVPVLFVFEEGKTEPVMVYPHEKESKDYSIVHYLKTLVE